MRLITFLLALLIAAQVQAISCFEQSPARQQDRLHEAPNSERLSERQREQLIRFFDRLSRDRDGYSEGFYCKQGKGKVSESFPRVSFRSQELDEYRFDFRIRFQGGQQVSNEQRLRYTIGGDKLLLGPNERGNDIVIKRLTANELITYEKYRKRSPEGTSIVREAVRHYRLNDKRLTVSSTYYINGALQAQNNWLLD